MKNKLTRKRISVAGLSLLVVGCAVVVLARCGSTDTSNGASGPTYTQIERLGRPAVNEGLVISNANLILFNMATPAQDLTSAATPVLTEATAVLTAIHTFSSSGATPTNVAAGFIPDVMRINTFASIPVGTQAYTGDVYLPNGPSGVLMLTGGRKLEDQVMNITLAYLFAGTATAAGLTNAGDNASAWSDKLSYDMNNGACPGGNGTNLQAPGHHCLVGQTAPYGSATFPYLATPN